MKRGLISLALFGFLLPLALACAPAATPTPIPSPTPTIVLPSPTASPALPPTPTPTVAPGAPTPTPRPPTPTPAPATATPEVKPKYGGKITSMERAGPPDEWDPHSARSWSVFAAFFMAPVFSTVVAFPQGVKADPGDLSIRPSLAESWEWQGPQKLVLRLAKGVKFHNKAPVNGRELTSADIKYSLERMVKSKFGQKEWFASITSVDTPDRYTAVLNLKEPDPGLLTALATGYARVLPKEAGKPADPKYGLEEDFREWTTAIGTGPFQLEGYTLGVSASYKKHDAYFKAGLPYLDRLEFLVIPDSSTRVALLRTGKADLYYDIPRANVPELKGAVKDMTFIEYLSEHAHNIGFRTDKPPFNDVRVRRAVSLSYNQDQAIAVWQGLGTPSYGGLPPLTGAFALSAKDLGDAAQWYKYDPKKARELLAEAGYPQGFSTAFNTTIAIVADTLPDLLAAFWKDIGLDVQMNIQAHPVFLSTTRLGKYEGMGSCGFKIFDPTNLFETWLPESPNNCSHVDDPWLTERILKQKTLLDFQERKKLVDEIQRYAADKVYIMPLPYMLRVAGYHRWVKGYNPHSDFNQGLALELTWVDK